MRMPSEPVRAWLYRVVVAALAVGVVYGVVDADRVDAWTNLAAALLGLVSAGLAAANTSTKAGGDDSGDVS